MDPDSAIVLFLDKVVLPVVMQDLISGLDVQKTVDVPQLQFLTPMVALPVEIPQRAVLGQGLHARCCVWRRWPDSAENCGDSTGAVLDKVYMPVVIGLVPMARQCRNLWRCRSFSF